MNNYLLAIILIFFFCKPSSNTEENYVCTLGRGAFGRGAGGGRGLVRDAKGSDWDCPG